MKLDKGELADDGRRLDSQSGSESRAIRTMRGAPGDRVRMEDVLEWCLVQIKDDRDISAENDKNRGREIINAGAADNIVLKS
jgi:hypothetical protein